MDRRLLCGLVALVAAPAHADGIAIVGGSPRAIGRAGAATVGDDGGGALLINPAAMARRDTTRIELGAAANTDSLDWQSASAAAPRSVGRGGTRIAPLGAGILGLGDWVIGLGAMTSGATYRSLARPPTDGVDQRTLEDDLEHAYDYRYAGIAGSYRRDTIALGAARRFGDSLALGLAIAASRVSATEHRRFWAGLGVVHRIGTPTDDVDVSLSGTDSFSPSAVAGVLYAPVAAPVELAAALAWTRVVQLAGKIDAVGTDLGPSVTTVDPRSATLQVRQPLAVRAGGRYVGERLVAELDGDLWIMPPGSDVERWRIHGIRIIDPSHLFVDLQRLPSRISQRSHGAVRAAVDAAAIPGFLWLTAGYAYATAATPPDRVSPTFGDLAGHTLGVGLEVQSGGATVTLGWSRTWFVASHAASSLQLDGPFYGTSGPVPAGTYDGSVDQAGVLVAIELGTPPPK